MEDSQTHLFKLCSGEPSRTLHRFLCPKHSAGPQRRALSWPHALANITLPPYGVNTQLHRAPVFAPPLALRIPQAAPRIHCIGMHGWPIHLSRLAHCQHAGAGGALQAAGLLQSSPHIHLAGVAGAEDCVDPRRALRVRLALVLCLPSTDEWGQQLPLLPPHQ